MSYQDAWFRNIRNQLEKRIDDIEWDALVNMLSKESKKADRMIQPLVHKLLALMASQVKLVPDFFFLSLHVHLCFIVFSKYSSKLSHIKQ